MSPYDDDEGYDRPAMSWPETIGATIAVVVYVAVVLYGLYQLAGWLGGWF